MRSIKVNLDKKTSSSYEIHIGKGILDRMVLLIAKKLNASYYVMVTDSHVHRIFGDKVLSAFREGGMNASVIEISAGESFKNMSTLMEVSGRLLELGADRSTVLIALGGGVVGDLTGFIASVYMRSIPYVQIPTTLVGQVDSSIGGKTAVDLPQGKNLLGTFYQPAAVFADLDFLETLPEKEFKNGLAEIIKYGVIEDDKLFKRLEDSMDAVLARDVNQLSKIIETCCRIKKSIVEIDEKEQGLRRILNFGHTLGHAFEVVSDYRLSHGEGVALGMIAAAKLSVKLKHLPEVEARRLEHIIMRAGLPVNIPQAFESEAILERLKMDKKKKDNKIHFVLIKKIGMPFVSGSVDDALISSVLEEMKA